MAPATRDLFIQTLSAREPPAGDDREKLTPPRGQMMRGSETLVGARRGKQKSSRYEAFLRLLRGLLSAASGWVAIEGSRVECFSIHVNGWLSFRWVLSCMIFDGIRGPIREAIRWEINRSIIM